MKIMILFFLINSLFLQNDKITIHAPTEKKPLHYVKETPTKVTVLTKEKPVEIEVLGPTWLKVDTRIPWHSDMKGEEQYTIIVQEDSTKETIFEKETFISKVIFGKNNKRYGESRYSLMNVPEGKHVYTFYLWKAKPETVLLDFSFTVPKIWTEILPSNFYSTVTVVGNEERQTYYTLKQDEPIEIKVTSPINIKVLSRLSFDKSMRGKKGYTILVKENDKEIKKVSFTTEKSEVFKYENNESIIPSKENRFFLWFPRGSHTLTFHLHAPDGYKASICFLKEEKRE
jgi:hypothetical protein